MIVTLRSIGNRRRSIEQELPVHRHFIAGLQPIANDDALIVGEACFNFLRHEMAVFKRAHYKVATSCTYHCTDRYAQCSKGRAEQGDIGVVAELPACAEFEGYARAQGASLPFGDGA